MSIRIDGLFLKDPSELNVPGEKFIFNQDYSDFPDRLKSEFLDELDSLCKMIAQNTQERFFKSRKENKDFLAKIFVKAFNGLTQDLLIQDMVEKTYQQQIDIVGAIQGTSKSIVNKAAKKIGWNDYFTNDFPENPFALEKCAAFLAKHANKRLNAFTDDEEGSAWLSSLFPSASEKDKTIRALFIRAQFLTNKSPSETKK